MRPTVEEQLHGTCRILESVVAPAVSEPYAHTILVNLIANLRMVTEAVKKVPEFFRADNQATLRLLLELCATLPPGLVTRINDAAGEPDEGSAMEARNWLLRGLLAEAVCSHHLTPEMRRSVETFMINRASRVPMRFVPTAPSATPSTLEK